MSPADHPLRPGPLKVQGSRARRSSLPTSARSPASTSIPGTAPGCAEGTWRLGCLPGAAKDASHGALQSPLLWAAPGDPVSERCLPCPAPLLQQRGHASGNRGRKAEIVLWGEARSRVKLGLGAPQFATQSNQSRQVRAVFFFGVVLWRRGSKIENVHVCFRLLLMKNPHPQ